MEQRKKKQNKKEIGTRYSKDIWGQEVRGVLEIGRKNTSLEFDVKTDLCIDEDESLWFFNPNPSKEAFKCVFNHRNKFVCLCVIKSAC